MSAARVFSGTIATAIVGAGLLASTEYPPVDVAPVMRRAEICVDGRRAPLTVSETRTFATAREYCQTAVPTPSADEAAPDAGTPDFAPPSPEERVEEATFIFVLLCQDNLPTPLTIHQEQRFRETMEYFVAQDEQRLLLSRLGADQNTLDALQTQTVDDVDQMVSAFIDGTHLALYNDIKYAVCLTHEADMNILPGIKP